MMMCFQSLFFFFKCLTWNISSPLSSQFPCVIVIGISDSSRFALRIFGIGMFFVSSLLQIYAHVSLARLRSGSSFQYFIPRHGLFRYCIAPHYTTEIFLYLSFLFVDPSHLDLKWYVYALDPATFCWIPPFSFLAFVIVELSSTSFFSVCCLRLRLVKLVPFPRCPCLFAFLLIDFFLLFPSLLLIRFCVLISIPLQLDACLCDWKFDPNGTRNTILAKRTIWKGGIRSKSRICFDIRNFVRRTGDQHKIVMCSLTKISFSSSHFKLRPIFVHIQSYFARFANSRLGILLKHLQTLQDIVFRDCS